MREIFPGHARLGPADPLPGCIRPAAAGSPAVDELVEALATRYAYPVLPRSAAPGGRPPGTPRRPWVRANMISSLDGAVAVSGQSRGLSGVADRLVFSVLRSLADVILVGAQTVRAEGYRKPASRDAWPQLRAGRPPAPRLAVITRRLDLDLCGRLFGRDDDHPARTIILTTSLAPADRRSAAADVADVIVAGEETVSAAAAIDALTGLGHHQILAEGGPVLLGQLLAAGLLDEQCLTISPLLEGGHAPRIIAPVPTGGSGPSGSGVSPGGTVSPLINTAAGLTGLTLAMVLEDAGFLLTRYVSQALEP